MHGIGKMQNVFKSNCALKFHRPYSPWFVSQISYLGYFVNGPFISDKRPILLHNFSFHLHAYPPLPYCLHWQQSNLLIHLEHLFTLELYFAKKLSLCSFMINTHESTLLPQKTRRHATEKAREESERRIEPETCHYEVN